MKPKYQEKDRVLPLRQSYIYIVDSCCYDEEREQFVYMVHGLDSPTTVKFFAENELSFAGFTQF
jgi:hypothetical protein